jgi:hypothetical protein
MTDFVLDQYELLYQLYCRDRALVPPGRLLELRFDQLDARPLEVLAGVYRSFGCAGCLLGPGAGSSC